MSPIALNNWGTTLISSRTHEGSLGNLQYGILSTKYPTGVPGSNDDPIVIRSMVVNTNSLNWNVHESVAFQQIFWIGWV